LAILAAMALALAGCGGPERAAAPPVPTVDPALITPGDAPLPIGKPVPVRSLEVPAGQTGVLGLDGMARVRPRSLDIADDATLTGLRWTRWDAGGAEGTGKIRLLECRPDCGQGTPTLIEARVRLSKPVACDQGTFFDAAEVTVSGDDPASFIQAPC
jgi:hypothetical protein